MKMRFSSESFHTELTTDRIYSSEMLSQNIINKRIPASRNRCVKKIQFWKKVELREDPVAEIIWNLGSKRVHLTLFTTPAPYVVVPFWLWLNFLNFFLGTQEAWVALGYRFLFCSVTSCVRTSVAPHRCEISNLFFSGHKTVLSILHGGW